MNPTNDKPQKQVSQVGKRRAKPRQLKNGWYRICVSDEVVNEMQRRMLRSETANDFIRKLLGLPPGKSHPDSRRR